MITAEPVSDLCEVRIELARFLIVTQKRSHTTIAGHRREVTRHRRTWPLTFALSCDDGAPEFSAALHDASPQGVGFLCDRRVAVGATIQLKLFAYSDSVLRVPAVVRHVTRRQHGYLIGCEFAIDTDDIFG